MFTFEGEITGFSSGFFPTGSGPLPGPSFSAGEHFTGSGSFDSQIIFGLPSFTDLEIIVDGFHFGVTSDFTPSINSAGFTIYFAAPDPGFSPFDADFPGTTMDYVGSLSASFGTGTGAFNFGGLSGNGAPQIGDFELSGKITSLESVPDEGGTALLVCFSAAVTVAAQRLWFRRTTDHS